MDLLVTEEELKEEYHRKEWLWDTIYQRIAQKYANLLWKNNPLILFPLKIDITLGNMRYHYYKYGITRVKERIDGYGRIIAGKLRGRDFDLELDSKEFYIKTVLTDEESILDQLDKEITQFY